MVCYTYYAILNHFRLEADLLDDDGELFIYNAKDVRDNIRSIEEDDDGLVEKEREDAEGVDGKGGDGEWGASDADTDLSENEDEFILEDSESGSDFRDEIIEADLEDSEGYHLSYLISL